MKKPLLPQISSELRSGESAFRRQKGQTLMLVAVSLVALIGLAALAIDVTTLYLAHSEAEKVADAAALAGAKAFVSTGFTSGGLGDWNDGGVQASACNGGTGYADLQAQAAANQNTVGGVVPTVTTACNFANAQDPQITVTVTRTALPTFFSRIFGRRTAQVTATAKAEAFNPSGGTTNISVANVKPWLVANCDPTNPGPPANPACPGSAYYLTPPSYRIANRSTIGRSIQLTQLVPSIVGALTTLVNTYYAVDITSGAVSCPSSSSASCGAVNPGAPGFFETVACSNPTKLQCGQSLNLPLAGGGILPPSSTAPALCLTHANGYGAGQGQDAIATPMPPAITGGDNNPQSTLVGVNNLSRSDSIVTVPIWDGDLVCVQGITCTAPRVVGFMQIGLQQVDPPILTNGTIRGVILNLSGCGNATGTPIQGSGDSPIPVRLVR
jgi:hypothetical protein